MKTSIKIGSLVIRILLSIVLLIFVWRNAHWSVALSLTLIIISIELATYNRLAIIHALKRRCDQECEDVKNLIE
jgi:hypothetical protein